MSDKIVRIGGASGYWGDTSIGPAQLIGVAGLDYMVFDYLAEITMSILAKAKAKDPNAGYATDFITQAMRPLIGQISEKKIRVVANAGGLNLAACRRALEQLMAEAGVSLRIGTVEGDDLSPQLERVRKTAREMDSGAAMPDRMLSVNAYLGAFPIAAALDAGADIVVTGRCVDSALIAGPLIHEFGWKSDDLDRLAAAGLAGHLLECGAQATGGNFTDWDQTADGWDNTGFPVAEVSADGSFVVTKPNGTGGKVTPLTIGEQMLYEIGDPGTYILPDVVCDFRQVTMTDLGQDRVRIAGARGAPPTAQYKVSATYLDGYACVGNFVVAGEHAAAKARLQGQAVLTKVRRLFERQGLADFTRTSMQIIGSESLYGDAANPVLELSREVVLRLGIHHPSREGADLFSKEFIGAGLSMAPGLTLLSPGRPKASPVVRLYSCFIDKSDVEISVKVDGNPVSFTTPAVRSHGDIIASPEDGHEATTSLDGNAVDVPLRRLAVARSGDKGDKANIGVIARSAKYLPAIRASLTVQKVQEHFAHVAEGRIERFDLPGIGGINFLLHQALGGGGAASLNLDPQAKTYAQVLLDIPIRLSESDARAWNVIG
ncbi:acyclic terpene utilization AtuA family protein [Mesorhizobium sp. CAU 1732]|uniref:acyclic terpene utilization AtuA family protein n=1 Tax=Mesorhizobium sp. CAU 1732 TaxID=3140358 RepID=UPI0032604E16